MGLFEGLQTTSGRCEAADFQGKSSYNAKIPAVRMVFPSLLSHFTLDHAVQNGLNTLSKQSIYLKYKQRSVIESKW